MESDIVTATWVLAATTLLLVVATAIPAVQRLLEHRDERRSRAANIVPDLHMLNSRLEGQVDRLLDRPAADADLVSRLEYYVRGDLQLLGRVIDAARGIDLTLMNELYVCRHLITQIHIATLDLRDELGNSSADAARVRDDLVGRCCKLYQAARLTTESIEGRLPARFTKISGESFWDRFSRITEEREREAEKQLVDRRAARDKTHRRDKR